MLDDEVELRREAVRRRLCGESTAKIAADLGRTGRWVRKWVVRYLDEAGGAADAPVAGTGAVVTDGSAERGDPAVWAQSRSRAPRRSPNRTPEVVRSEVIDVRRRLEETPNAQIGALAIGWELHRLGVDPVPGEWTINRIIHDAGLAKPRQRQRGYVSKGVPYPVGRKHPPGDLHQVDMVGPRHLLGGSEFSVMNLVDVGSNLAGCEIVDDIRPTTLTAALVAIWGRAGLPRVCQFDNHSTFRGAIHVACYFGPVVAACLDLGVTPRFIPLREPWRNGVAEHFNDVWDKTFFRREVFDSVAHLRRRTSEFEEFHNRFHRYSNHRGAAPVEIHRKRSPGPSPAYQPPTRLPVKGRIEVIRYVRSDRLLNLFGHKVILADEHTYRYVTAVIHVRRREVIACDTNGEVVYEGPFRIERELR